MFPTEVIDLPSKGLLYPKDSPLSSGTIEMKYMTAKEEDILTNMNYIEKGIVVDKLLQSLIVDKSINYDDLLIVDKNALLIAARILGYGKDYEFQYGGETYTIDLTQLNSKPFNEEMFTGVNEFHYTLPASGVKVIFKLLTHGDERRMEQEVKGMKKINKDYSADLSTRLKYMLVAVNDNRDVKYIRNFVDTQLLARDSRELRKHIREIQPDVDMKFYPENGPEGGVDIPIGISFLWPDAGI